MFKMLQRKLDTYYYIREQAHRKMDEYKKDKIRNTYWTATYHLASIVCKDLEELQIKMESDLNAVDIDLSFLKGEK